MNKFSIKDIEVLTGIKAHTLRIWEQRYQIVTPERSSTNIRYYNNEHLKKLLNINLLNNRGYKISELAKLSDHEINKEAQASTINESGNYPTQIQALTLQMVELNQIGFERVLSTAIMHLGLEEVVIHIVFPFLYNVGLLWQTGAITPAHEHFISNIIRQKLIVAIDGQTPNFYDNSPKYLLFLPENELHEAGLLFANYVIQARGQRVIYLGQNIPMADVVSVYNIYKPDYILTSITSPLTNLDSISSFVSELALKFEQAAVCFGGSQISSLEEGQFPANVRLLKRLEDFITFVDNNKIH